MWRRRTFWLALGVLGLGLSFSALVGGQAPGGEGALELPSLQLTGARLEPVLTPRGEGWPARARYALRAGGRALSEGEAELRDDSGALRERISLAPFDAPSAGSHRVTLEVEGRPALEASLRIVPAWLSILPPLLAILLAIALREVIVSLVAGVWLGATFVHGYDPLVGLLRTADTYAVGSLADPDHASIAIFSLALGGMVGVISRAGGARGLADVVTRLATTRRRGGLGTWLMGLVIFFDDYSNSLLVGSSMRPITDRLRISREKLAFLVDGTAAPVSSFALISSWVGVEVGYIADQYAALGLETDPYLVFLETIPYRFYPLLMLWFGLMVVVTGRDFGPMREAERRALVDGHVSRPGASPASDFDSAELTPPDGVKPHWLQAALPIAVVIGVALGGMYVTGAEALAEARLEAERGLATAAAALDSARALGEGVDEARVAQEAAVARLEGTASSLRAIFGKASSLKALLWAAVLGGFVAIVLSVVTRKLRLREAMEAWLAGMRSISLAVLILVLAWSLGKVCQDLHTADWVVRLLGGWLPAALLPAMVFVIAAGVSFATGTSWGTMGILFPLVVPLAFQLDPTEGGILLSSVASILAGSVWGDHCSPISDTTIMSSMASSCDHVDHVRTQLPYALAVGGVSLVLGEVATGFGLYGWPVALALGALALWGLVRFVGRPPPGIEAGSVETPPAEGAAR